jgi:hypothetical protein
MVGVIRQSRVRCPGYIESNERKEALRERKVVSNGNRKTKLNASSAKKETTT